MNGIVAPGHGQELTTEPAPPPSKKKRPTAYIDLDAIDATEFGGRLPTQHTPSGKPQSVDSRLSSSDSTSTLSGKFA